MKNLICKTIGHNYIFIGRLKGEKGVVNHFVCSRCNHNFTAAEAGNHFNMTEVPRGKGKKVEILSDATPEELVEMDKEPKMKRFMKRFVKPE